MRDREYETYELGFVEYVGAPGQSAISKSAMLRQIQEDLSEVTERSQLGYKDINLDQAYIPEVCLSKDPVTLGFSEALGLNRLRAIFLSAPKQEIEGNSIGLAVKVDRLDGVYGAARIGTCLGLSLAGIHHHYDRPLNLPLPKQGTDSSWEIEGWKIQRNHYFKVDNNINYGQGRAEGQENVLVLAADPQVPLWEVYVSSVLLPGGWQNLVVNGRFSGFEESSLLRPASPAKREVLDLSKKPVTLASRIISIEPGERRYLPDAKRRAVEEWEKEIGVGARVNEYQPRRLPRYAAGITYDEPRVETQAKTPCPETKFHLRKGIAVVVREVTDNPIEKLAENSGKKWWEETGRGKMSILRKARQNGNNHRHGNRRNIPVKGGPAEKADSKRR